MRPRASVAMTTPLPHRPIGLNPSHPIGARSARIPCQHTV